MVRFFNGKEPPVKLLQSLYLPGIPWEKRIKLAGYMLAFVYIIKTPELHVYLILKLNFGIIYQVEVQFCHVL